MKIIRFFKNNMVFFIFFFHFLLSCTNVDLNQLDKRIKENINISLVSDLDPAGSNTFQFIVVGDTHVGNPAGKIFEDYLSQILTPQDAFILLAGDVTQAGLNSEFNTFLSLMLQVGVTYKAAIGNHDLFFGGWSRWKSHLGRSLYSFNADDTHIVMLDSANGVLGKRQLDWLRQDLVQSSAAIKIVVSHYPPWVGRFSSLFKMGSDEEAALLKDILYEHRVDLMFSGHFHGYEEITIGCTKYVVTGGMNNLIDPGEKKNYVRVYVEGNQVRSEVNFF